jgi:hypothetical protein
MIAVLGIMSGIGLGRFALYPVLAALFFPWGVLYKYSADKFRERQNRAIARETAEFERELAEMEEWNSGRQTRRHGQRDD